MKRYMLLSEEEKEKYCSSLTCLQIMIGIQSNDIKIDVMVYM